MSSCKKCGYYSDGECNICGMGMSGEDTFCRLCKDNLNCYYKQLSELKVENERLSSWLANSEKQRKEVCNVIHKKKEQIQTLKYMLFDEKEIPKDKFVMYYRIAQNERRTKSHRDLCTNIVKKYKQTLQEIKGIAKGVRSYLDIPTPRDVRFEMDRILDLITKAEEK